MPAVAERPNTPEDDLIEEIALCFNKPLRYVMLVFPWGEEGTILWDEKGPDAWQVDILVSIEKALFAGEVATVAVGEAIRVAVASGHGIGKSALIAWIIKWFIATRPNPQIVVTASSQAQLSNK